MRRISLIAISVGTLASIASAQENGPYKVLKMARVGGEGGWDYISPTLQDGVCIFPGGERKR